MTTSAIPNVVVREATAADLPHIARLLSVRDEQPRDVQTVGHYLWGLAPEHARGWIAMVDGEPAGYTMFYLRQMHWPPLAEAADATSQILAGYWAHLFVDPRFRKLMIYPQLVLSMFRGMKAAGVSAIFTAMRRPTVTEAHLRLGFRLVGDLPVKLRPLRPWRLLAKHKGWAALAPCCAPWDALYSLVAKRRTSVAVESIAWESPLVDQVVDLLNSRLAGTVHQRWNTDQLRRRYRVALDGTPYRLTAVRSGKRLEAALVTVLAERGNRIRTGVLLELVAQPDADSAALQSLLGEAEQFAKSQGAEVMLSLASTLALDQLAGGGDKYLVTRAEKYQMIVYPQTIVAEKYAASQIARWNFQFGDHDAF